MFSKRFLAPKKLSIMLTISSLLFIFTALLFKIRTYDFWLHLAVGRHNLTNGIIQQTEIFNFSRYGVPWFNHEWLYQICLFVTYLIVGLNGIVIVKSLLITAIFYLAYKNLGVGNQRENVFAWLLLLLALSGSFWRLSLRPHIFSLFLTMAYLFILQLHAANRLKHPYFLIILQFFWVNIHGGTYFLGYIYVGAFLFEQTWRYISNRIDKRSLTKIKQLLMCLLFSIMVSLLNPYTYHLLIFPFIHMQQSYQISRLDEWQSLNLDLLSFPLIVMSVFVLFALPRLLREKHWGMTLVTLLFAALTVRYVRFGVEFLLIAIWPAHHFLKHLAFNSSLKKYAVHLFIVAMFVVTLSMSIITLRTSFIPGPGAFWPRYPLKAANFIDQNFEGWKVINPYNWGGFLLWQLPKNPIFIDGRQLPPEDFAFKTFVDLYEFSPIQQRTIQEVVENFEADLFLYPSFFNRDISITKIFPPHKWGLIYFDGLTQLYLTRNEKHELLLARYEYIYVTPANIEPVFYQKLLQDESRAEAVLGELKRAVAAEPNSFAAVPLAQYYLKQRNFAAAIDLLQTKLSNNPKTINNWFNLGKAYKLMGKKAEAEKYFKKAEELKLLKN